MGEIKQVKKAAIIAMLGAPILFMIYWTTFYWIAYYGFSGDFWAAASYFAPGGSGFGTWAGWPFGAVMPMPSFMLVFLNSNVSYSVIASLGFSRLPPTRAVWEWLSDLYETSSLTHSIGFCQHGSPERAGEALLGRL